MQEVSVPQCNTYIGKQSGKDFTRPMYKKMIRGIFAFTIMRMIIIILRNDLPGTRYFEQKG